MAVFWEFNFLTKTNFVKYKLNIIEKKNFFNFGVTKIEKNLIE